jgi:hypothetical protein
VILAATLCLAWAGTAAAKSDNGLPVVVPKPVANYVKDQGVAFAVDVHNSATSVRIKYGGDVRTAEYITTLGGPKAICDFCWQANFKNASRKQCYNIQVTAQNKNGTVTRKRKACRLGQQSQ